MRCGNEAWTEPPFARRRQGKGQASRRQDDSRVGSGSRLANACLLRDRPRTRTPAPALGPHRAGRMLARRMRVAARCDHRLRARAHRCEGSVPSHSPREPRRCRSPRRARRAVDRLGHRRVAGRRRRPTRRRTSTTGRDRGRREPGGAVRRARGTRRPEARRGSGTQARAVARAGMERLPRRQRRGLVPRCIDRPRAEPYVLRDDVPDRR